MYVLLRKLLPYKAYKACSCFVIELKLINKMSSIIEPNLISYNMKEKTYIIFLEDITQRWRLY